MVALDLTTARAATETLMIDACTVTYDAPGADDDTLDQDTGALTPPDPDVVTVYAGPCHFHGAGRVPNVVSEGGVAVSTSGYEAAIPSTADVPPPGAVFRLTACATDAALVDRSWRVKQTVVTSVNLRRLLVLEDRASVAFTPEIPPGSGATWADITGTWAEQTATWTEV